MSSIALTHGRSRCCLHNMAGKIFYCVANVPRCLPQIYISSCRQTHCTYSVPYQSIPHLIVLLYHSGTTHEGNTKELMRYPLLNTITAVRARTR
jgi:hypothetical protein